MKCSDIQLELSLYSGSTTQGADLKVHEHLNQCPVCREELSQFRSIRTGLNQLSRPALPQFAVRQIRQTVISESRKSHLVFGPAVRRWIEFQLMTYGIGAAASVVIGLGFLTMMFSGMFQPDRSIASRQNTSSTIMLANSFDPYRVASPDAISPDEFARSRMAFAGESPSVNPQGALVALTKSFVRGGMRDEAVVIVADVFGNGLARISEVVEPSDDDKIVEELRRALDTDPAFAPFLPSSVESRPESVRVVFMMQSVNVSTRDRRGRGRVRL